MNRDPLDVAAEELWNRNLDEVNRIFAAQGLPATSITWNTLKEEHRQAWRDSVHRPARGSEVEAWLIKHRDEIRDIGRNWYVVVEDLLDDYRLRADTGLLLNQDISEAE